MPLALAEAVLTTTPAVADDETFIRKFMISVPPTGRQVNVLQTNPPRRSDEMWRRTNESQTLRNLVTDPQQVAESSPTLVTRSR